MDSAKVIRLAESAGGKEYGPLSWNMTFKQDALIRFAALIQQSLIDEGWRSPEQVTLMESAWNGSYDENGWPIEKPIRARSE